MANDKRNITTSPRILELKRKQHLRTRRMVIIYSLLFLALITGLSFLSSFHRLLITNIVVEGTHIIDGGEVRDRVFSDMQGKYLYLFTKQNSFIYPKSFIVKDLRATFPRIEDLNIRLEGINTIHVVITERTGSYLWCGASVPVDASDVGDNCYFVNSDGYIFDRAPYFSGNIYFKFYIPLADSSEPLNKNVLEPELFRPIISFVDGLTELGFHPISVVLTDPENYAFHLAPRPSGGEPEVMFKQDNDLTEIFTNLASAMKNPDFKNEMLSKQSTLLYIDLRFKNKVLYKFQ